MQLIELNTIIPFGGDAVNIMYGFEDDELFGVGG